MVASEQASIVCVGSTMVDLLSYLERMPQPGETAFGRDFVQGFGGKGANQAVMAAILGARVWMVNSVGSDTFGRETIDNFRGFGVDTEHVRISRVDYSGVANILVDPDGDNRIILGAGANAAMTPDQVDAAFDAITSPDLVMSQLEVPQEVILRGFERAAAVGATTVLNPGPAARIDPRILARTDWLIPNETEFALIFETEFGRAPADEASDIARLADRLRAGLIITVGSRGALWAHQDGTVESFPAPDATAVDTTGAGDAFCGSFAYGLASGWPPSAAISLAVAVASASVTRRGTQPSYPTGVELDALVAACAPAPGQTTAAIGADES